MMRALLDHRKIQRIIADRNLKQEEFAEKVGISDRHVRNLCKKDVDVAVSLLYKVSTEFQIPPEALLTLQDDND